MINDFELKNKLIEYLRIRYPTAFKIEFEFFMQDGIVVKFGDLTHYNIDFDKKKLNPDSLYSSFEQNILGVIELNEIISEEDTDKNIKGIFTVELTKDLIYLSFYNLVTEEQFMGEYKI
jgi:hypothetical protein